MKKIIGILFGTLILFVVSSCATYKLELINDESNKPNISTQYPNYINMLVRVTNDRIKTKDSEGNSIPDFSNPKFYVTGLEPSLDGKSKGSFAVMENGQAVKVEAGLRVVPLEELELHINLLLDVSGSMGEKGLVQAKNAVKRLIARPCTEEEIAAKDPGRFNYVYTAWDDDTKSFVERNEIWISILKENQIVTIYTFADKVTKIQPRTTDAAGRRFPDKARQLLATIDKDIHLGVDSTNLYGAFLAGLDDLRSVRSLNDPKQGFVDGIVVAFTDGSHTSGNIQFKGKNLTPGQAIKEIGKIRGDLTDLNSLKVITIAVKSPELIDTIPSGDLKGGGLKDIQNSGYLKVDNYNKLKARFTEAFELIDRYTRSLYWVYYRSPKSGSQKVDIKLEVSRKIAKKGFDQNAPVYSTISQSVQINGFYQVLPGVYINDPILDEKGTLAVVLDNDGNNIALKGPEEITITTNPDNKVRENRVYSLILANNPDNQVHNSANTQLLKLHTYVRANDNRYKPSYVVTSSDETVVSVIGHASLTVIESVALLESRRTGTATIKVVDTANGNLVDSIIVHSVVSE